MRNVVAIACVLLGACAFEPGSYEGGDRGGGGGSGGGPGDGMGSDGSGATMDPTPPQPLRTCSWDDPDLRLCLEFEDGRFSPMVSDASVMQLDVPATGIGAGERYLDGSHKVGAAAFLQTSSIHVPETDELDISDALTIELWVHPVLALAGDLVANSGQYRMQMSGGGRISCQFGNSQVASVDAADAELGRWTHVACSFDGQDLAVYVNGGLAGRASGARPPTGGTNGTRIGGIAPLNLTGFNGWMDDIRIYSRGLLPAEICQRATGQASCPEYERESDGPGGK